MKPLKEFRIQLKFDPKEIASRISYIVQQNIDFDVFLPTKNCNLQRQDVWDIEQRRELMYSILIGRHIPHCSIIVDNDEKWEIIDGKQRIKTIVMFLKDMFTIEIDNDTYLFSELDEEYKRHILSYHLRYYVVNDGIDYVMDDEDKITWFKFLNFAGTQMDKEHLKKLV